MEVNGTVRLLTVCFTPFLFQAPAFVDDMALSFTHVVNLGVFFPSVSKRTAPYSERLFGAFGECRIQLELESNP
jgi:hypothetical protein